MSPTSSDRSLPTGALLAIGGAVLALISLLLPWFTVDPAALASAMSQLAQRMGLDAPTSQAMAGMTEAMRDQVTGDLRGYNDSPLWVAARVATALGVFGAALKIYGREHTGESQRAVFAGAAVVFALRPVISLVSPPGGSDLDELGISFNDVFAFGTGLYLSFFASLLMVGAAVLAHVGDRSIAVDDADHVSQPAPSPAYVPHGAPAPSPAYVPHGAPAPSPAYVPHGAPSSHAGDRPAPSPALPPEPSTTPPAPRERSVAPPGFG